MSGVQTVWGWPIAIYLFLAGVAAGAYLSAAYVWYKRGDNPVSRMGIFLAAPCLGVSILFLFFDLGAPLRFMLAFLKPFSSMISVGTWVLTIFFIIAALQWLKCYKAKEASLELSNAAWIAGIIFAVATAVYTGVLLGVVKAIPFWNTPLLPVLFFISSVSTGIGALLVGVLIKGAKDSDVGILHSLSRIDLVFVGLEVLVLLFTYWSWGKVAACRCIFCENACGGFLCSILLDLCGCRPASPLLPGMGIESKTGQPTFQYGSQRNSGRHLSALWGLALRYLILAVGIFEGFSPIL